MIAVTIALGALNLLVALYSFASSLRYLRGSGVHGADPPEGTSEPGVTLVVPCCGDEPGLEGNLEALLIRAVALSRVAPRFRVELRRYLWAYALFVPLVSLLTVSGVLRALVSRRISWRGKTYEMHSPTETVVLDG